MEKSLEIYRVTVACYKTVYTLAKDCDEAMKVVERNINEVEFDPMEDIDEPEVDSVETYACSLDEVDEDEIMTYDGFKAIKDLLKSAKDETLDNEELRQLAFEQEEAMLNSAGQQELPFNKED